MRRTHLPYLSDPLSHESFTLTAFQENPTHIESGLLVTPHGSWYPIIAGIPRLLTGELRENLLQEHYRFFKQYHSVLPKDVAEAWQKSLDKIENLDIFLEHQKQTGESFAYEWQHIYRENDYEKENFFHFLSPFLKEQNLQGKITLDIGCGSGRFTKWAALSGTALSFGSDLGESVIVAYQMTKDLPNACIVQADIYHMPFRSQFDTAYSIGVLHHLPEPEQGFRALPSVLKQNGQMLIWVYNRRNNARALYFYEPLRSILRHLPKPLLFKLCYIPGGLVHSINLFGKWLGSIGFPELEKKFPFAYYRHFPFNMKLNDAFDVLATPKSNYYYREEIEDWFKRAKLKDIQAYEHPEAGITCVGTYPTT